MFSRASASDPQQSKASANALHAKQQPAPNVYDSSAHLHEDAGAGNLTTMANTSQQVKQLKAYQQMANQRLRGNIGVRSASPAQRKEDIDVTADSLQSGLEHYASGDLSSVVTQASSNVIQRRITGRGDIWAEQIGARVVTESSVEVKDAIHRLHSINTAIYVTSYDDLRARINRGEFNMLLQSSMMESKDAKYDHSKVGEHQADKKMDYRVASSVASVTSSVSSTVPNVTSPGATSTSGAIGMLPLVNFNASNSVGSDSTPVAPSTALAGPLSLPGPADTTLGGAAGLTPSSPLTGGAGPHLDSKHSPKPMGLSAPAFDTGTASSSSSSSPPVSAPLSAEVRETHRLLLSEIAGKFGIDEKEVARPLTQLLKAIPVYYVNRNSHPKLRNFIFDYFKRHGFLVAGEQGPGTRGYRVFGFGGDPKRTWVTVNDKFIEAVKKSLPDDKVAAAVAALTSLRGAHFDDKQILLTKLAANKLDGKVIQVISFAVDKDNYEVWPKPGRLAIKKENVAYMHPEAKEPATSWDSVGSNMTDQDAYAYAHNKNIKKRRHDVQYIKLLEAYSQMMLHQRYLDERLGRGESKAALGSTLPSVEPVSWVKPGLPLELRMKMLNPKWLTARTSHFKYEAEEMDTEHGAMPANCNVGAASLLMEAIRLSGQQRPKGHLGATKTRAMGSDRSMSVWNPLDAKSSRADEKVPDINAPDTMSARQKAELVVQHLHDKLNLYSSVSEAIEQAWIYIAKKYKLPLKIDDGTYQIVLQSIDLTPEEKAKRIVEQMRIALQLGTHVANQSEAINMAWINVKRNGLLYGVVDEQTEVVILNAFRLPTSEKIKLVIKYIRAQYNDRALKAMAFTQQRDTIISAWKIMSPYFTDSTAGISPDTLFLLTRMLFEVDI
ncbi:hypothetical protein [Mucilaginibacter polytrichastri]|uniref:Uncharacterized protein n=1 Tax=Mucilaginibacter polytrichastri TaxID=1302689 RepID=A0A1Q5ZXL8_9SPHI|nr:hypothetical protein [Mucilaginibacter polytrichastri]OKS86506.1 hypothetical protein RG47T_1962 [Mucilaginibacter polytrichastri]SFS79166.1 hypothetical protein SAMN04487890_10480 [Mucilaginibacter polytrichastri]